VDLHRLCFPLDEEAQDVVALRLILGLGACARLHLKQSRFAFRLFARYRDCFRGQRVIFYRFCDPVVWVGQEQFEEGWGFDFISSHFEYLWRIVADHEAIVAADRRRIGVSPDKWVCIKARHQVGRDRPFRGWTRRLLWASRICKQKRPEVLSPLADLLQRELPDVVIEVYGSAEDGLSLSTLLGDRPNLIYAGPFVSFNADEVDRFDFFVYSAWYDGLPNVVLEAMSSGLPVIAPRVGGLPEAVITGTNGVLIDDCPDDGEMARRYLDALKSLYSSPEQAQGLRNAARAFISEGFSAANHQAQVKTALLSESGQ
jgi:glycosyltransferase involved in cell wall biosynthesis